VAAHDDGQLYYARTDYTLWYYPIMYPEILRSGPGGDQPFMQFVVPTAVDNSAMSSAGRNVSWYEALFDTYNLFIYPRCLSQGYFFIMEDIYITYCNKL
jgi:hypothetical protein